MAWKYAIAPLLFQAEAMGTLNDLVVVDGVVDGWAMDAYVVYLCVARPNM